MKGFFLVVAAIFASRAFVAHAKPCLNDGCVHIAYAGAKEWEEGTVMAPGTFTDVDEDGVIDTAQCIFPEQVLAAAAGWDADYEVTSLGPKRSYKKESLMVHGGPGCTGQCVGLTKPIYDRQYTSRYASENTDGSEQYLAMLSHDDYFEMTALLILPVEKDGVNIVEFKEDGLSPKKLTMYDPELFDNYVFSVNEDVAGYMCGDKYPTLACSSSSCKKPGCTSPRTPWTEGGPKTWTGAEQDALFAKITAAEPGFAEGAMEVLDMSCKYPDVDGAFEGPGKGFCREWTEKRCVGADGRAVAECAVGAVACTSDHQCNGSNDYCKLQKECAADGDCAAGETCKAPVEGPVQTCPILCATNGRNVGNSGKRKGFSNNCKTVACSYLSNRQAATWNADEHTYGSNILARGETLPTDKGYYDGFYKVDYPFVLNRAYGSNLKLIEDFIEEYAALGAHRGPPTIGSWQRGSAGLAQIGSLMKDLALGKPQHIQTPAYIQLLADTKEASSATPKVSALAALVGGTCWSRTMRLFTNLIFRKCECGTANTDTPTFLKIPRQQCFAAADLCQLKAGIAVQMVPPKDSHLGYQYWFQGFTDEFPAGDKRLIEDMDIRMLLSNFEHWYGGYGGWDAQMRYACMDDAVFEDDDNVGTLAKKWDLKCDDKYVGAAAATDAPTYAPSDKPTSAPTDPTQAPTESPTSNACANGAKDASNGETDVDCGGDAAADGGCVARCLADKACLLGRDCASGECTDLTCTDTKAPTALPTESPTGHPTAEKTSEIKFKSDITIGGIVAGDVKAIAALQSDKVKATFKAAIAAAVPGAVAGDVDITCVDLKSVCDQASRRRLRSLTEDPVVVRFELTVVAEVVQQATDNAAAADGEVAAEVDTLDTAAALVVQNSIIAKISAAVAKDDFKADVVAKVVAEDADALEGKSLTAGYDTTEAEAAAAETPPVVATGGIIPTVAPTSSPSASPSFAPSASPTIALSDKITSLEAVGSIPDAMEECAW